MTKLSQRILHPRRNFGENLSCQANVIVKNLSDLTADDLKGFDAVVDAFGAWTPDTLPQQGTTLKHLCDILGGEELVLNSKGESVISYADYAIAMVDELVKGDHIQQRISVVAE